VEPITTASNAEAPRLIDSISHNVPAALSEVVTLGRTLTKRAGDILAYFDRPGTSNGPTEAICEYRGGWSGTGWSGWCRSCRSGVTLEAIGPRSGCLSVDLSARDDAVDTVRPTSMT
jgi:hypothetical protein